MTRVLRVDSQSPDPQVIAVAAAEILSGHLVAFPTETVYGLGANALDDAAVRRIFMAKGRPAEDPLIVHLASREDLSRVARVLSDKVVELTRMFWPGPLTLVLPRQPEVPKSVTAGLETVAVRVPAHAVALALLRASGVPIAAPSANRFGHASPTTARHVLDDLGGRIELILDGGPTTVGVESTVLDMTHYPPVILRPGGVTREALEGILGRVLVYGEQGEPIMPAGKPPPSPGMLKRHYAPRARLILYITGDLETTLGKMAEMAQRLVAEGAEVGLLVAEEDIGAFEGLPVRFFNLGSNADLEGIARRLFAGLRALDEQGVEVILARDFGEQGLALAIRDRLRRAAQQVIS